LLAQKIADYYRSTTGQTITDEECSRAYVEQRELLKGKRSQTVIEGAVLSAKDQECPEVLVFKEIAKILGLDDLDDFVSAIQKAWLSFDLRNIKPIPGMLELVAESVSLFGRDHVGVYSNHSFSEEHLITILEQSGYLRAGMLDRKNVFLSSVFGREKHGVGLRKPNSIAFNEFSKQLLLNPMHVAFVGDNKNDSLFAVNSGGIGVLI
jgi:FMN phosphatase YigB (HAD superfamily)